MERSIETLHRGLIGVQPAPPEEVAEAAQKVRREFVMIMGEFATAVVVYGGKTTTVGTVILNCYAVANYPFAAVNALMLMLAMMLGVVIILRIVDIRSQL